MDISSGILDFSVCCLQQLHNLLTKRRYSTFHFKFVVKDYVEMS